MAVGKILIIDDETDLLETMKYRLTSAGYDVVVSANGVDGIKVAKNAKPDVIILDVMMPGIDGFDTLERFKRDPATKDIPVIVSSCGSEEDAWAKKSLGLGAAGYVVKPFDAEALLFTVGEFVKHRRGK
jgi:DNA-binding response OmpR family regulator